MTHLTDDQIAHLKSETTASFWQDWRVELLKTAHEAGKSAGQIAEELGCTRNMAIGKTRRLGLEPHAKPATTKKRKPRIRVHQKPIFGRAVESVEAVELPTTAAEDAAIPRERLRTLFDLECGMCRWPMNDGSPYLFCGAPSLEGHSWCPGHAMRAYNPGAYKNALRPYVPGRAR